MGCGALERGQVPDWFGCLGMDVFSLMDNSFWGNSLLSTVMENELGLSR